MRSDRKGRDHQYEAIEGNSPGESPSRLRTAVPAKGQENRTATDRINDRKQSADYQKNSLSSLDQQRSILPPGCQTILNGGNYGVRNSRLAGYPDSWDPPIGKVPKL